MIHILNLGAGVQSTTVYLLAHEGKLHLDYAIFADTQEEPAAVYRHLDWMQTLNGIPILRRTRSKLGDDLSRGVNATGQRFASIPAYTAPDGVTPSTGQTRRQCSREYKTEVIWRAIRTELLGLKPRQRWPRDVLVQYFGISRDEASRSVRIKERVEQERHGAARFPLIEMGWTRSDCLRYLANQVPHEVLRSACVFCPYHSDQEWKRLKRDAVSWARILEIDRTLRKPGVIVNRGLKQKLYLHRSALPIEEVDLNENQLEFPGFVRECEGMCGV